MSFDRRNEANVPQGLILGQDEEIVAGLEVKYSLMLPNLTSTFAVTNRRFLGHYRTGWFGTDQFDYPLTNVASVSMSTGVSIWQMLVGIGVAIAGLVGLISGEPLAILLGLIIIALGVLRVISSLKAAFAITNNANQTINCPVTVFDRVRAQEFAVLVSSQVGSVTQRVEIVNPPG